MFPGSGTLKDGHLFYLCKPTKVATYPTGNRTSFCSRCWMEGRPSPTPRVCPWKRVMRHPTRIWEWNVGHVETLWGGDLGGQSKRVSFFFNLHLALHGWTSAPPRALQGWRSSFAPIHKMHAVGDVIFTMVFYKHFSGQKIKGLFTGLCILVLSLSHAL